MSAMTSRRRSRWAVPPSIAALLFGAIGLAHALPANASTPNLAPITPAALTAKVAASKVAAFSGTVQLTTHLGLPDVGSLVPANAGQLSSLLAGVHTADVWFDGPTHARIGLLQPAAEADWVRNGADLWAWDSTTQQVMHTVLHDQAAGGSVKPDAAAEPATPEATPADLANKFLAAANPSTDVTVRTARFVAGRAAYELVLMPRSTTSTVKEVVVGVDAVTGMPLETQVTAKNATSPAIDLRFTKVSFTRPSASKFNFTPPAGAHVIQVATPGELTQRHGDFVRHLGAESGAHGHWRGQRGVVIERKLGAESATGPAIERPAPLSTTRVVGDAWDRVVIASGAQSNGQLFAILKAAKRVTIAATSGRLLSTSLVNVFIADDGRIAAGLVAPSALVAALTLPTP
jgi:outer membrane lipoprotein-sorting protein